MGVSTHSRPKAAATHHNTAQFDKVGFNTQPPEGGCSHQSSSVFCCICFNTQPPEGGCDQGDTHGASVTMFQHTAARRRLRIYFSQPAPQGLVSTHSRPKAAARAIPTFCCAPCGFNTQPPEGGCKNQTTLYIKVTGFNTQPPEGGC